MLDPAAGHKFSLRRAEGVNGQAAGFFCNIHRQCRENMTTASSLDFLLLS
jgi:hypothetical protein